MEVDDGTRRSSFGGVPFPASIACNGCPVGDAGVLHERVQRGCGGLLCDPSSLLQQRYLCQPWRPALPRALPSAAAQPTRTGSHAPAPSRRIARIPIYTNAKACWGPGKPGVEKILDTARKMALPIDGRRLMGELMR